jgi:hypothetical protein
VAALQPVAGLDRQTAKILKISEKYLKNFVATPNLKPNLNVTKREWR